MSQQHNDNNTTDTKHQGQERTPEEISQQQQQQQQTSTITYLPVPTFRSSTSSPGSLLVSPPYIFAPSQTPQSADPAPGYFPVAAPSPFRTFPPQPYIKQEPLPGPPELLIDPAEVSRTPSSIFSPDQFIGDLSGSRPMSSYSSSSQDSVYSTPGPQSYRLVSPYTMNDPRSMSQVSPGLTDKDQLINSLRTHRVNTLTELRRIEKIFAHFDQAEFSEPMTTAWAYYVNSNNFLSELRGLTRNYPFSSECLDEAKWKVIEDPASTRSWNYCWLVLMKIQNE
ncbi:hypothetical protein FGG08_005169 [Glutinoglossum americanum]|uniref:Uncharacterized protein n=1 Tax=Glutinoglossum americanum TaxID=1670608 RepID=A0A9P8KW99_9PEZI|nr:hypothetical protein FGG08_005169 [Glutinoglossum americanum]